ncbi:hypothetical protein [Lentzea flava]|uniref:Uncharacterized protein n=1 Tax=Lentzea flava TaxID=103732 RepID=A0ABQ2V8M1_9PSEU|nr:hypothetical protein [Lentzea flava]MCP2203736.1 hypothetical protein [Lentzea flava]GGU71384.1 hypothetical protein GCM10010178_73830 [Lentzea flava]
MEEVSGYVFEDNLGKVVEHVAWCAGYRWDDLDDGAVEAGLKATDEDADVWFDYPIGALTLHLTRDHGGSMIRVRVTGITNEVAAVHLDTILGVHWLP